MKKIHSYEKLRLTNARRARAYEKNVERREKQAALKHEAIWSKPKKASPIDLRIKAPSNIRLFSNTKDALKFIKDVRLGAQGLAYQNNKRLWIDLSDVTEVNYGTISILRAVMNDLRIRKVRVGGNLPKKRISRQYVIDSGYLNGLKDIAGRRFPVSARADLVFFTAGKGVLTEPESEKISKLIEQALTLLNSHSIQRELQVKSLIMEACGNSIEWAETKGQQWMLGMTIEDGAAIFTVTDVGLGILETLPRNFRSALNELTFSSRLDVLKRAFGGFYGSRSGEGNRNNGLPLFKSAFDEGKIKNLIVLTNNVILRFGDEAGSYVFPNNAADFAGTLYQFQITAECLLKKDGDYDDPARDRL